MSITVVYQSKDGSEHQYTYDAINGTPVNDYMRRWMKNKRERVRQDQGLPPPPKRAADVTQSTRDEILTLHKKKWRVTDISLEVGFSAYLVKKIIQGAK